MTTVSVVEAGRDFAGTLRRGTSGHEVIVLKRGKRDVAVMLPMAVMEALEDLEDNPRPPGVKMLKGQREHWRIRVGDWRILYTIEDRALIVLVIRIGHRREVYREPRNPAAPRPHGRA